MNPRYRLAIRLGRCAVALGLAALVLAATPGCGTAASLCISLAILAAMAAGLAAPEHHHE